MVEATHSWGQIAVNGGLQLFFVLFVWRMARRLYPLIDRIKEMDLRQTPPQGETGTDQVARTP